MEKNTPFKRKSFSKTILIGCVSITIILLLSIVGIYFTVFSGSDAFEITEYHPFRSERAQERYLALYDAREKTWPVPFETKMVETSFGSTYVRISGPEHGPVLVLLHGVGGNSLHWIPNVAGLSQSYRVYALDNIYDNGRSIYIRRMETPGDFVSWMDEVFTNLDLGDDINLVGLSNGGWLASQYALHHPGRLGKIVLIAPAATVLPISTEWVRRALLSFLPHRYFARSFMFWLLEDFVNQDDDSRAMVEEWTNEAYVAARSFKLKSPVSPTVLSDYDLSHLRVPTLFMVGENEKIYSAGEAVARLNSVAPDIETVIIPGAGHDLTLVQADLVNQEILDFLGKP